MDNGTYFYFMFFENLGYIRYALFTSGLILYCVIILFNAVIIITIFWNRTLHQPMYILISCLSVNSVYGTAGFFPRVLIDLLSDTHSISREACFLQSFVIYTYITNENTILMLMALDRFVAISKPLQYHNIITKRFLTVLYLSNWAYSVLCIGIAAIFTAGLKLCGNKLWKVFCHNYEIAKLSCVNSLIVNIIGLYVLATTVIIPLSLIIYSYVKILIICRRSSPQFKKKSFQTCVPHIVVLLNFSVSVISEITLSRVVNLNISVGLSVFISLEFLLIPPILNPLVYGLSLSDIRKKNICLRKLTK
ncbi:odorant receptor 128-6 [Danio rerio]|uniref:Odorant receptor n=1 Tax=Danio rerio TaxID=7955 RepID=Q2PRF9_DANRE|nr:odorant receptor 128-6 [Danio rerio]ABC43308.1 odorant receptor [Danio rerio]|eukprot:NP_001121861.1 odorant receptor, family E, subfamily 128, member 6 [Danio rerio]